MAGDGVTRRGKSWRAQAIAGGVRLTSTHRTKAAGLAWKRETETDLLRGDWRDPRAGDVLFSEWVEEWALTRGTLQAESRDEELAIARNHLVPALGSKRLSDIKPLAVEQLISGLTDQRAAKTVRNIHGVLSSILKLAVREQLIASNPCVGTRLPKNRRVKPRAFLTEQQLTHLIACTDEYWRPLVLLLAATGMRWSEATGLHVGSVDLLGRQLRVLETVDEAKGDVFAWKPYGKSDAATRTLRLPADVVDALVPLVSGRAGDEVLFVTDDGHRPADALESGRPVRHRWFDSAVWQPACREAGLVAPRPTPHDLRHTHAALLIADNVPLSAIKDRLGHESIETTDRLYGYLVERVHDQVLASLDRVFTSHRGGAGEPSVTVRS